MDTTGTFEMVEKISEYGLFTVVHKVSFLFVSAFYFTLTIVYLLLALFTGSMEKFCF